MSYTSLIRHSNIQNVAWNHLNMPWYQINTHKQRLNKKKKLLHKSDRLHHNEDTTQEITQEISQELQIMQWNGNVNRSMTNCMPQFQEKALLCFSTLCFCYYNMKTEEYAWMAFLNTSMVSIVYLISTVEPLLKDTSVIRTPLSKGQ